ncbi:MAG: hypothetical protein LBR33_01440 [Propionibacteriaceae bacterium]|jgi:hypothetical protein|nr:hypothetical protein [Propionibacteriaceae bacterium]
MKRLSRVFLAAAILAGGVFAAVSAPSASAEDLGYNGVATVKTSASEATPGQSLTLNLTGFGAAETVKVSFHSDPVDLQSAVTDSKGEAQVTVAIPADAEPGAHTIVAVGQRSGRIATFPITIKAAGASATPSPSASSTSTASSTAKASSNGVPTGNTGAPVNDGLPLLPIGLGALLVVAVAAVAYRRVTTH